MIEIKGQHLVAAPTGLHMVNNYVTMAPATQRITAGFIPHPDIPDDHVIGAWESYLLGIKNVCTAY